MAQIVAGSVGAIFGELLAEAEIGRAMQAGDETVDDGLGDQIEAGNSREDLDRDIAARQAPDGGGIDSSKRCKIWSESMRSDSAWKFSRMRCRSTGMASDVMSS